LTIREKTVVLETKLLEKILGGNVQGIMGTHPRPLEEPLGTKSLIELENTANCSSSKKQFLKPTYGDDEVGFLRHASSASSQRSSISI
jgi:hypothetical protein